MPLESADNPIFRNALRVWNASGPVADDANAASVAEACDDMAPLYRADICTDATSGWSIVALNRRFGSYFRPAFRVGDHPDQKYLHQVICPGYVTVLQERRPNFHLVRTRIERSDLGRSVTALYQRLLLPFERKDGVVSIVHLACILMVVDNQPTPATAPLSPRETQCLSHLIGGRSAKQIAFDLDISQKTVENCIFRLRRKLEAATVAQAAAHGILYARDQPTFPRSPNLEVLSRLSRRERECVGFLASGYTAAGIAEQLALSRKTVEKAIDRAKCKLGAGNAQGLVAKSMAAMAGF
jgi:DNA-binding NarL/FixJ family response regulator